MPYRQTVLTCNVPAIVHNLKYLEERSHKRLIPVIKANAYGTDDFYLAKILKALDYDLLAVSSLDEALHLRKHGYDRNLLILGYTAPQDLKLCKNHDLSIIIPDETYLKDCKEELKDIKVHIKIDTGMHRLGIEGHNLKAVLNELLEKGGLVEGVMTHFALSDQSDQAFTALQYQAFKAALKDINYHFKYIHCANTDATLTFKEEICNYARSGLGILGYSSYQSDLRPSLSLHSEIINVRHLPAGSKIGYGQIYTLEKDAYIGIMPIGYADGLLRKNTGRMVYVNDQYVPIVGNICMDQSFVSLNEAYPLHTPIEIFGKHITLESMAKELDTIPYEIITNISERVTRVFVDDEDKVLYRVNYRAK